jgi:hypothetical protein
MAVLAFGSFVVSLGLLMGWISTPIAGVIMAAIAVAMAADLIRTELQVRKLKMLAAVLERVSRADD